LLKALWEISSFVRNAADVIEVLDDVGVAYILYKSRKPFDHVSVDLDVLIRVGDVPKAVRALVSRVLELLKKRFVLAFMVLNQRSM
jgi:hypothetical protein